MMFKHVSVNYLVMAKAFYAGTHSAEAATGSLLYESAPSGSPGQPLSSPLVRMLAYWGL